MKKILITGSNGLLGQKLVKLIRDANEYELIATSRGENRMSDQKGYTYESMDITRKEDVLRVFNQYKPEYVIHGAAMTNVDQCEEDKVACDQMNVHAVQYIVDACKTHDAFLCAVSTDFIFDGADGPYKEDATPNPLSYYGESKLKGEEIVKASTLKWAIARTVLVYGITEGMSRSNIILWVKNSLEQGKELQIVNDQWRTPTLAEDLAMGCYLIVKKEAEGIYNISGKELLSPYDMAIATADFFDLDKSLINETDGSKFQQKAKRPAKTGFILDKAEKDLDYKPHSFEDGIRILNEQIQKLN